MTQREVAVHDSIDAVTDNQWNNLVSQSETGSLFQRTEWLRAIERGYGSTPRHAVVRTDGNVIGVLPNFAIEVELPDELDRVSRFAPTKLVSSEPGFGGPVTASNDAAILDRLYGAVEAVADGVAFHQLTVLAGEYLGHASYLERRGYGATVKSCRFVVDLAQSLEEIEAAMSKDRRRNLRKGRERDHRIRESRLTEQTLGEFYPKYARALDRVGADPVPRPFFEQLAADLSDRTKLFTLEVDGERRGTHLYLRDDERSALHHYASAVAEADFEYYPSELLHARAIEWAKEQGYARYDFGETPTDFDDGLYGYKKQFGGDPVATLTWEAGLSTVEWPLFRLGRWFVTRRRDA